MHCNVCELIQTQVHDAIGYQSKGVFFGSDSDEMSYSPPAIQNPKSKHLDIADKLEHSSVARFETLGSALERPGKRLLKPCRQDRGPSLNLESVTNMELAEAEVTQMPLRLVEDTVSFANLYELLHIRSIPWHVLKLMSLS